MLTFDVNKQTTMRFNYNDGGRSKYFKSQAGDCVCRSIAITAGLDYMEVYNRLAEGNATQRQSKKQRTKTKGKNTASNGIYTKRKWFKDYMKELGFEWVSCMGIGTGCQVHLKEDELPNGKIICVVSKHYCAVVDGVINDTYDPSRDGTRCVYGYWKFVG
tara:strand:- start:2638 stop:3117 length:480 start_codon:yes stop_codon:yes gene_type:complete